MLTVVGLDPSFSGLGIVAVPSDWACSLERVRRKLLASKPGRPLVDRICDLACDVCTWIDWARGKGSVEVFIEGGITGRGMGDTVRMQIELGAVIKHELRRELGIEVRVVEQNSARKLFLGKIPMSDRKDAVIAEFDRRWPAAGWEHDAVDALVTANAGMAELGLEHVTTAAPPKAKRPRRAKGQVAFA